jgi:hypothetical protein
MEKASSTPTSGSDLGKNSAEDEPGDDAVEEKVVPLDGGADCARDDGAAQLAAMHTFG